jgi:hypothetical protein
MCKHAMLIPLVSAALLAGTAEFASASPEMPWSSIDGGAARMAGAGYTLTGTVGQHDAGGEATGNGYSLRGGYWQIVRSAGALGCNLADLALPYGVLDLAAIRSFVNAFPSGDLFADLNEDGVQDLSDISAFVGAFTGGGP